jgi:ribosome biogenesis protein UTP30
MAATGIIDGHVSAKQCKLAVDALLKHETQRQAKLEESSLLPGKEQHVWLQVTVKQMHPEKKLKPHKMYASHVIRVASFTMICNLQSSRAPHRRPSRITNLSHYKRPTA